MSPIRSRRALTTFALLATLALVPSLASARTAAPPRAAVHAPSGAAASLLSNLLHGLRSLWGQEGVSIDPHGAHATGTSGTTGTSSLTSGSLPEGASIDPHG